jgi:hypothetical protein
MAYLRTIIHCRKVRPFVVFDPSQAGRSNPIMQPHAIAATFPTKTTLACKSARNSNRCPHRLRRIIAERRTQRTVSLWRGLGD